VRALADLGPGVAQDDPLDLLAAVEFDDRLALFRRAKGEADVLEGTGEAPAPANAAGAGGQTLEWRRVTSGERRIQSALFIRNFPCVPVRRLRCCLDDLGHAHPLGDGRLRGQQAALAQDVFQAQLDGIHAQRLGQLVHLALGGEGALRAAKAAERAAGDVVGGHGVAVDVGVGDDIGAGDHQVGVAQHFGAGIGVGAAVEDKFGFDGSQFAVAGCAPSRLHPPFVALVVADDALRARPDDAHRSFDAALVQAHGGQAKDDLQRHVLAAAERPADGRVDDAHPVDGQPQRVGDLLLVFVRPLAADLHRDAAFLVDVADAGFGLEVGVLLVGQVVFALDDDLGRGPAGGHVALADQVVLDDIAAVPGVEDAFVLHCLADVGEEGALLPLDLDQAAGAGGDGLALGDDQGHVVAFPEADVGVGFVAAQADEYRLVVDAEAIFVDRHVLGRQHGDDTGQGLGCAGIDRHHASVGLAAEQDAAEEQIGRREVAGIERVAGHFVAGIHPLGHSCA